MAIICLIFIPIGFTNSIDNQTFFITNDKYYFFNYTNENFTYISVDENTFNLNNNQIYEINSSIASYVILPSFPDAFFISSGNHTFRLGVYEYDYTNLFINDTYEQTIGISGNYMNFLNDKAGLYRFDFLNLYNYVKNREYFDNSKDFIYPNKIYINQENIPLKSSLIHSFSNRIYINPFKTY